MVDKILKNIEENRISEICKTAETFLTILKDGALEMLSAVVENVDAATLQAKKERGKDGITVKQRNVPRTVTTSICELTYKRTYCKHNNGTMIYLTDHISERIFFAL